MEIGKRLKSRYSLEMREYDQLLNMNKEWLFGIKDKATDLTKYSQIFEKNMEGRGLLMLLEIKNYHRKYKWS